MSDSEQLKYEKLSKKIYGGYIDVNSTENTVTNYTKLASDYEKDFVELGYETPRCVAEEVLKLLGGSMEGAEVLDVTCGTGLVADGLRALGFKGAIDGIDGSKGMLEIAEGKNIYRKLEEKFIFPDQPMPFADNSFDAVVCCGGFGPGHLVPEVLSELIRVARPRGVVVFSTRYNQAASDYLKRLNVEIERLIEKKVWKQENLFQTTYFCYDAASAKSGEIKPLLASIYCCRKE